MVDSAIIWKFAKPILIFIVALTIYLIIKNLLQKYLIHRVKTKKMRHNITVFTNLLTYVFITIAAMFIMFSFTGNIFSIGLTAGLLTAALGWALQRPITGIAGWIMVLVAKPFEIGDRIIIGGVHGDVVNITLTHIYLKEFGGTIGGEETSGRIIMVPNSLLFEQNVINYTFQDEFILDEVALTITYESNVEKAREVCIKAAKKILEKIKEKEYEKYTKPYVRMNFQPSGVDIRLRYYTPASDRLEIHSKITEEILKSIHQEKSLEIAYPHQELILRKKK